MAARGPWRWILAATLAPAAAMTSYGCAIVGGISPPAPVAQCQDGQKNGDETSVDCGGACGACDGDACAMDAECKSAICYLSACTPATNPDACPMSPEGDRCQACHSCDTNAACVIDADCAGGLCKGHLCIKCDNTGNKCPDGHCLGRCLVVTCENGVMDGDETGIDCGGSCATELGGHACDAPPACDAGCGVSCPMLCDTGKPCASDLDCLSHHCDTGGTLTCTAHDTCTNSLKDGDETDTDCGGTCSPCQIGQICVKGADCVTGACQGGTCSGCADMMKDGTETDVDCGGGACPGCANGQGCTAPSDCAAANSLCIGSVCWDCSTQCGGPCKSCVGLPCGTNGDCAMNNCQNGICRGTGCAMCSAGSTSCGKCLGDTCASNVDCFSNSCAGLLCL